MHFVKNNNFLYTLEYVKQNDERGENVLHETRKQLDEQAAFETGHAHAYHSQPQAYVHSGGEKVYFHRLAELIQTFIEK